MSTDLFHHSTVMNDDEYCLMRNCSKQSTKKLKNKTNVKRKISDAVDCRNHMVEIACGIVLTYKTYQM